MPDGGDLRPNPDPTRLTIVALDREITMLRKEFESAIVSLKMLHDLDMRSARELADAKATAIKDQVIALGQTYTSAHSALVARVDDANARLIALEAMRTGGRETSASTYAVIGLLISMALLAATSLHLFTH